MAIELAPLRPEAHHNRAVIYERQGNTQAAIDEYRTALRYDPRYEASRQALVRLTGSATAQQPTSSAEKLATALTTRASELARRGDYPGAMKALDEAERIAPRWVTVHQYRANVAFLMGDRERAIAALRKALELEPGNALFQANLRRLEEKAAPAAGR